MIILLYFRSGCKSIILRDIRAEYIPCVFMSILGYHGRTNGIIPLATFQHARMMTIKSFVGCLLIPRLALIPFRLFPPLLLTFHVLPHLWFVLHVFLPRLFFIHLVQLCAVRRFLEVERNPRHHSDSHAAATLCQRSIQALLSCFSSQVFRPTQQKR